MLSAEQQDALLDRAAEQLRRVIDEEQPVAMFASDPTGPAVYRRPDGTTSEDEPKPTPAALEAAYLEFARSQGIPVDEIPPPSQEALATALAITVQDVDSELVAPSIDGSKMFSRRDLFDLGAAWEAWST